MSEISVWIVTVAGWCLIAAIALGLIGYGFNKMFWIARALHIICEYCAYRNRFRAWLKQQKEHGR